MGPLAGVGAVMHSQCGPLDELLAASVPVALVGSMSEEDTLGQQEKAKRHFCLIS